MIPRKTLRHNNPDQSATIYDNNLKKKGEKDSRYKRLNNHTWGIGLEHETQLFHRPALHKLGGKNKTVDFIVFDTLTHTINILKNLKENKNRALDIEFIEKIPFEATGRKCNGKMVVEKVPFDMPEFITDNPFSSLKTGKRPIESYCLELKANKSRFIQLLNENKTVKSLSDKYGSLVNFAYGYVNYLKIPELTDKNDYKFSKKLREDYVGSYHLTLTLPHNDKTTTSKFISMHKNYANMLQWLEPLLVATYFSSDQMAMGTTKKRVRGSPRVLMIGWGNLAGSDIRKFNKGIGRYSVIESKWRKGLDFHRKEKLKPCLGLTPPARREGGISALSSDFRTFGSTDPSRPWHRESGAPMTKPNGIEFRIFDQFKEEYLQGLCIFLIYVAENSRTHTAKKYVYNNKAWINAVHTIMMNGWRAMLSDDYVKELRNILGLKINTKIRVAAYLFDEIVKEIYKKNRNGDWSFLMLEKRYNKPPSINNVNRESWDIGFMIRMNRNKTICNNYNKFLMDLKKTGVKSIKLNKITEMFYKYFSEKYWGSNILDVIYFIERFDMIHIIHNPDMSVRSIKPKPENISKITNFSRIIGLDWRAGFSKVDDMSKNILS